MSDEPAVWNVAETKCQQMHGHLLSVEDNDEYAKILEMRSFRSASDYIWIGLHRLKFGSNSKLRLFSSDHSFFFLQNVLFLDAFLFCGQLFRFLKGMFPESLHYKSLRVC